jgi:DNA (cytosine-5)-methyltransferase 1
MKCRIFGRFCVLCSWTRILRRLLPIELERLNGFPDNHTKYLSDGVVTSDVRRAFIMGNALVVGVVERLGIRLLGGEK